jgi:hypothetical protein
MLFGEITYTSHVFFGVAFRNAEAMREVLAVYAMDPLVQKLNIMSKWTLRFDGEVPLMFYKGEDVNWSPGPGGWSNALMGVRETAGVFRKERGSDFDYAWYLFRFGENYDDVDRQQGAGPVDLLSYLSEKVTFNRSIEVNL